MPDLLATPGLGWLVFATFMAGMVRGFAGFGTALIYLPIASTVLSPVWAIMTLLIFDLVGPLPTVPRALREGHPRDVLRLAAGLAVTLPLGFAVLLTVPAEVFGIGVSLLAFAMLAALISGWRYQGNVTAPKVYGIGALAGFLGGAAGLPGPPVILFYMARPLPATVVRATLTLFLLLYEVLMLGLMSVRGALEWTPLLIGAVLIVPNLLAIQLGAAMFRPERERVYRRIAYTIIAGAALMGLPIWGG
jgi:hypothetical protein